jgi:hypothetical protein
VSSAQPAIEVLETDYMAGDDDEQYINQRNYQSNPSALKMVRQYVKNKLIADSISLQTKHKNRRSYFQVPDKIKLYYFDFYGRAEMIRMLLDYEEVAYEDIVITKEQQSEMT